MLEETNQLQAGSIQFVSSRTRPQPVVGGHTGGHTGGQTFERIRAESATPDLSLKNSERTLIVQALEKTGGNKTKAAALLGISRDVLRYRMNKLNLDKD